MKKKMTIPLISICILLFLTGCTSETEEEEAFEKVQSWFFETYTHHDILQYEFLGDDCVMLTGSINPGTDIYGALSLYVIDCSEEPYVISAQKGGDTALSTGFTVNLLTANNMTMVFGELAHSVYDFATDMPFDVDFREAHFIFDSGEPAILEIMNDSYYLYVHPQVDTLLDVEFFNQDQTLITKYTAFYSSETLYES